MNAIRLRGAILIVIGCCNAGPAPQSTPQVGQGVISPHPTTQHLFDRLARAPRYSIEHYECVIALRPQRGGGRSFRDAERHVVLQAAFYAMHAKANMAETGTKVASKKGSPSVLDAVIEKIVPEIRAIYILLPLLDAGDPHLRQFITEDVLGAAESSAEGGSRNGVVRALTSYVRERRNDPPWSVVQILYWKAPSATLLYFQSTLLNAREDRPRAREIFRTQHTVQDVVWKESHGFLKPGEMDEAIAELDKLSKYPEWWVKLYVAEMLRRHASLRTPTILRRLRQDENPLVAKAADVPFHRGAP